MQQAILGDRYRLLEILGGGGMAKVYLAHDEVLDRDVALKLLREQFADDGEFVERFRREARSAASLRHPNIVQVYDQGRSEDGSHYIAMEHVPGGTLKDRIVERGCLGAEEAASVALKVAEALAAAHKRGVIHRDIKPQNVLLDASGEPKVADFGIARAASAATISQTSHVLGTAGYMSPEQALGERACPRSDLYSLGVVLYEMLVGTLPYEADTPVAVAVKHINEPPRPPEEVNEDVPPSLGAITVKLLAKSPEDRYPDASALAGDLRRVLDGLPPAEAESGYAPPARSDDDAPTIASPVSKPRKRKRGGLRTAVAVIAGLLLLGGFALSVIEAPWEETSGSSVADRAGNVISEEPEAPDPEVPGVVGLSEDAARDRLTEAGFEVESRGVESSESEAGNVVNQSVPGGERAKEGSAVEISVGEGPDLVETPNLIYEAEAAAQLEEAGLVLGEVAYAPNDALEAGVISSQNPARGTEVEEGAAVDIVVSTGPEVEPAEPAPVETEPVEPAPVETEPVETEPVEPEPVEPVEPEPAAPSQPSQPSNADQIIDDVFDDVGIEE
ncbi:MAG: Stk1 family PASTA domain-containing Ser/Thr kinase [Rubrobacteraceae bacterium]